MRESTNRRRPRGGGTVYPVGDGWRGSVFVTVDGTRSRRYVSGATEGEAVAKLRTAQADADAAATLAASPTFAWWATRWLATIRLRVRPSTFSGYSWAIRHALPILGDRPLVELRPTDIEALLGRLVDGGMAASTAALVRRVLVVCLSDAERDGRIIRNVAAQARGDVAVIARCHGGRYDRADLAIREAVL